MSPVCAGKQQQHLPVDIVLKYLRDQVYADSRLRVYFTTYQQDFEEGFLQTPYEILNRYKRIRR
jgi:hypothetical protein